MTDRKTIGAILTLIVGAIGGYLLVVKGPVDLPINKPQTEEDVAISETIEFVSILEGIDPDKIEVVGTEERDWPNSCLGLPQADEICAQAIVPGYRIVLSAEGIRMVFHTDRTGASIRQSVAEKTKQ